MSCSCWRIWWRVNKQIREFTEINFPERAWEKVAKHRVRAYCNSDGGKIKKLIFLFLVHNLFKNIKNEH